MKKLLIALMSMASFAALAVLPEGTSFEGLTVGDKLDVSKDDQGGTDYAGYWLLGGETSGVTDCIVTNRTALGSYTGESPAIAGDPNEKALYVDTDKVLERTINGNADIITPELIGDKSFYVDTLVQFTAADAAEAPSQGDKLVVWMQAVDADEANGILASTNLVVTAGKYDASGNLTTTNYIVAADGVTVNPNEWHRLTIKSLPFGSGSNLSVGFVVFIDEVMVTSADAAGAFGAVELDATAQAWAKQNALFPSLVKGGSTTDAQKIYSLGLKGVGAVDDITFTDTAPRFAADGSYFTLNWTAEAFETLIINGTPLTYDELAAGKKNFEISGDSSDFLLEYQLCEGFEFVDMSLDDTVKYDDGTGTFTATGTGTATINTKKNVYEVGGNSYDTFSAALTAAANDSSESAYGKIKLLADVVIPSTDGSKGVAQIIEEQYVIIDLAGHTIQGSGSDTIKNAGGYLIITNSTQEIGEVLLATGNKPSALSANDGTTIVYGGIFRGVVREPGEDTATLSILGGSYLDADYEAEEPAFYLQAYTTTVEWAYDSVLSDEDASYITVGAVTPEPTGFTVTWENEVENVDEIVAKVDRLPISSGASVAAGTEVTFFVTAKEGYTYEDVRIGAWGFVEEDDPTIITLTITVTKNVVVTIPAPEKAGDEPTTYTVTFSTNGVENVVETISEVEESTELEEKDIPAIFNTLDGEWDVDPVGAVITCDTNFNFAVAAPQPKTWTVSFYTNDVDVANLVGTKEIVDKTALAEADIPAIFGTLEGTWNTNPTGAVITAAADFVFTIAEPSPSTHDIANGDSYIDCDGDVGAKTLTFSSIQVTADGWKVGLGAKAIKVPTDGAEFTLVCKTELTSTKTVELPAVLTTGTEEEVAAGIFTIAPKSTESYDQLFILGVGPAKKPE